MKFAQPLPTEVRAHKELRDFNTTPNIPHIDFMKDQGGNHKHLCFQLEQPASSPGGKVTAQLCYEGGGVVADQGIMPVFVENGEQVSGVDAKGKAVEEKPALLALAPGASSLKVFLRINDQSKNHQGQKFVVRFAQQGTGAVLL